jgi:tripartite-type tricarboxylate transporter receptor subunit TctC
MTIKTRMRTLLAAGALLLLGTAAAQAQDKGPIRMVVPFGAGTTTDTVSRVVGEALGKALQQPVIVDNRAGAGGSTGSDLVAKSAPDGRTLVMGTVGTHAINAALFTKLPYDPMRDFAPVAFIGYTPTLLVVAAESPLKSLKDLAQAAAKPRPATAPPAISRASCSRSAWAAR